jgi:hypothetical protein
VKLYDLLVEGYHTPLTAPQIAELFHAGQIHRNDPCKEVATERWKTIDELFPLLKYHSSGSSRSIRRGVSTDPSTDNAKPAGRPGTSALKAGWVCFAIGLSLSWFSLLGNAFFSIAFITAIVAMCAHEVNRGLILLLSTFCGAALCALIFFTLVIGTMGVVDAPAIEQANASLKQTRAAQARFANQIAASNQQLQSIKSFSPGNGTTTRKPGIDSSTLSLPPNSLIKSRSSETTQNTQGLATRQAYAIEQANQAAPQGESDRARQREAIQQAEAQRDRINAREQKLEQIQKSIDWYETNIRDYQSKGWDWRFLEQERDELIKQRWDLESR